MPRADIKELRRLLAGNRTEAALAAVKTLPALLAELEQHRFALTESVRLQSHYAALLNQYDGGNRKGFADAAEWIERLAAISKGYGIQPTTKAESGGGNADR